MSSMHKTYHHPIDEFVIWLIVFCHWIYRDLENLQLSVYATISSDEHEQNYQILGNFIVYWLISHKIATTLFKNCYQKLRVQVHTQQL